MMKNQTCKLYALLLVMFFSHSIFANKVLTPSIPIPIKFSDITSSPQTFPLLGTAVQVSMYGTYYTDMSSVGIVKLQLNRPNEMWRPVTYNASLKLTIYYKEKINQELTPEKTVNTTLNISYKSDMSYTDKSVFQLPNAYAITKIVVTDKVLSNNSLASNIELVSSIETERYYTSGSTYMLEPIYDATKGELTFKWGGNAGTEYDLEWTHINAYSADANIVLPKSDIEIDPTIFDRNSTRVTVKGSSYTIPYIYNRGYLLFRVRSITNKVTNGKLIRIEGPWTVDKNMMSACPNLNCNVLKNYHAIFDGTMIAHQENLNWQYTANYAEEGKSKLSMTYADGSLRARQSQTRVNTDKNIVVGETIYDHQGRAAVQAMPTPAETNKVDFIPGFNRSLVREDSAYSKEDFDFDHSDCGSMANPMDSILSGASKYYSSMNWNKQGMNAYIPTAEGYPFSQVQYTADNTGRVKAQGGVGKDMQIQEMGNEHATRYFYATPTQRELDRLFGSEVGYEKYYKKNMVLDPNKQLSISYLDPSGKVIATSLAGNPPNNLDPIPSTGTVQLQANLLSQGNPDLLYENNNVKDENLDVRTLSFSKAIAVDKDNDKRTISYSNSGAKLQDNVYRELIYPNGKVETLSSSKCYDCVFDLDINLKNPCGVEYINDEKAHAVIGQEILDNIRANSSQYLGTNPCNSSSELKGYVADFVTIDAAKIGMPVGTYMLTKLLRVNEEVLNAYADDYIKRNEGLYPQSYFEMESTAATQFSGCMSCPECEELKEYINTPYDQLPDAYKILKTPACTTCFSSAADYQIFVDFCKTDPCKKNKVSPCEIGLKAMLADMSPHGQYGELQESGKFVNEDQFVDPTPDEAFTPELFPLSIFNANNQLVKKQITINGVSRYIRSYWRNPYDSDLSKTEAAKLHYYTINPETGNEEIAYVTIIKKEDGTYNIPITNESKLVSTDQENIFKIEPQYLANLKDFVSKWKKEWANSLVFYHPEYNNYAFCDLMSGSHNFDAELKNMEFENMPASYGKIDILATDPFFNTVYKTSTYYSYPVDLKTRMGWRMHHYSFNEDQSRYLSIWQTAWYVVKANYTASCQSNAIPVNVVIDSKELWDVYKMLYASLKRELYDELQTYYSIQANDYCGCIGDENFRLNKDNFYQYKYNPFVAKLNFLRQYPSFLNNFQFFRSQAFNPQQPCNYKKYRFYADKVRNFTTTEDGLGLEPETNSVCYSETNYGEIVDCNQIENITDENINLQKQVYTRNSVLLSQTQSITQQAIQDECFQCPQARNVQSFLNTMAETRPANANNFLTTDGVNLSCDVPMFLQTLEDEIVTGTGSVTWDITNNSGGLFEVNFVRQGNSTFKLKLKIPENEKAIYSFNDIIHICCLNYITNPSVFEAETGKNFEISGSVLIKPQDPLYDILRPEKTKKIILEGVSGFNIGECDIEPSCDITDLGNQVINFFDILLFQDLEFQDLLFQSHFVTANNNLALFKSTSNNSSEDNPFEDILSDDLKMKLDQLVNPDTKDEHWYWTSSKVGNTISGIIHPTIDDLTVGCRFTFTSTTAFDSITSIVKVTAIKDNPNACKLIVNAKYNGLDEKIEMICESSCISMGSCPAKPMTNTGSLDAGKANTGYYNCEVTDQAKNMLALLNSNVNFSSYQPKETAIIYMSGFGYEISLTLPSVGLYSISDIYNGSLFDIQVDQTKENQFSFIVYAKVHDTEYESNTVMLYGQVKPINIAPQFVVGYCKAKANPVSTASVDAQTLQANLDYLASENKLSTDISSVKKNHIIVVNDPSIAPCPITLNLSAASAFSINDIRTFSNIEPIQEVGVDAARTAYITEDTYFCDGTATECMVDNTNSKQLKAKCGVDNQIACMKFDISTLKNLDGKIYLRMYVLKSLIDNGSVSAQNLEFYYATNDNFNMNKSVVNSIDNIKNAYAVKLSTTLNIIRAASDPLQRAVYYDITDCVKSHDNDILTLFISQENNTSCDEVLIASAETSERAYLTMGDAENNIPAATNNFSILAHLNNGTTVTGYGYSDCIPMTTYSNDGCKEGASIYHQDFETGFAPAQRVIKGTIEKETNGNQYLTVDSESLNFSQYMHIRESWSETLFNLIPNKQYTVTFKASVPSTGLSTRLLVGLVDYNNPEGTQGCNCTNPILNSENPTVLVQVNAQESFIRELKNVKTGTYIFASPDGTFEITNVYNAVNGWVTYKGILTAKSSTARLVLATPESFCGPLSKINIDDISVRELNCNLSKNILCDYADFPTVNTEIDTKTNCLARNKASAGYDALHKYDAYLDSIKNDFKRRYIGRCLSIQESMDMTYSNSEHHYTLYYYDQAGNLVRTIPPEGVNLITKEDDFDQILADRNNGTHTFYTQHSMPTTYTYNSLNQLRQQSMPDQDNMNIWEKQNANGKIPTNYQINSIAFINPEIGIAATQLDSYNGYIYSTKDGGKNWYKVSLSGMSNINDIAEVSATNKTAFAVGDNGLVLKIVGQVVTVVPFPSTIKLKQVYFDNNNGFVFDIKGNIWRTTDTGVTWLVPITFLSSRMRGDLSDVCFSDAKHAYAISTTGQIFQTIDQGNSWQLATSIRNADISNVYIKDNAIYTVGKSGMICKYNVLNQKWDVVPNNLIGDIKDIHFASNGNGYASTSDGLYTYAASTNTWTKSSQYTATFTNFARDNSNVADQNAYVGSIASIYKTTNNNTLIPVYSGSMSYFAGLNDLEYFNGILYFRVQRGPISYVYTLNGSNVTSYNQITNNNNIRKLHNMESYLSDAGVIKPQVALLSNTIISKSIDTWSTVQSPDLTPLNFVDMSFYTQNKGYAINSNGVLYEINFTVDKKIEVKLFTGSDALVNNNSLTNLSVYGDKIVISGSNGQLFVGTFTNRTSISWSEETYKLALPTMNGVYAKTDIAATAVGVKGIIASTIDGNTWVVQKAKVADNINSIDGARGGQMIAVGDNGMAISLDNRNIVSVPPTKYTLKNLNAVCYKYSPWYAAGDQYTILSGTTQYNLDNTGKFLTIKKVGSSVIAAGENGKIYYSPIGNTFTSINEFKPQIINAICMVNEDLGYAVGNNKSLYKITQKGENWIAMPSSPLFDGNLIAVHFTSSTNGVVLSATKAFYTTDGGYHWFGISLPSSFKPKAVHFVNNEIGLIVGDKGIYKTEQGVNGPWVSQTSNNQTLNQTFNSVYVADSKCAYAVGPGIAYRLTSDGWKKIENTKFGRSNYNFVSVKFIDCSTGYIIAADGTLFKTINFGVTWEKQP